MKKWIYDKRVSLWELDIREFHMGNLTYALLEPPEKGGSCMVYHAQRLEQVGEEIYSHEVLLKEFYPLLDVDESAGIHREKDGSLRVPEATRASSSWKNALRRFLDSYGLMVKLGGARDEAEHFTVATFLTEAGGTWYVEEAYDTGQSLAEIFGDGLYSFDTFLAVFEKCLKAVERLHDLDFYHLDLKPQNISYTKRGVVKFFDVDSFVKKERLEECPDLAVTEGYSAPELQDVMRNPEDAPYLIGPWTDLYSMTQILCWYLYGHPLEEYEMESALETLHLKEAIENSFGEEIPVISRKGLYRLRLFLMCGLHASGDVRYQELSEAVKEIRLIREYLFYKDEGEPHDNFRETEEWLEEYEGISEQLHQEFFPENQWWNTERVRMAALIGISKEEREEAARFYATVHRLDFSNIIEIHAMDFTDIVNQIMGIEKEGNKDLLYIRHVHKAPCLFLIFDASDRTDLSRKEAREIAKLTMMDDGAVLFVSRYNRQELAWNSMKKNFFDCNTIDLDEERSEQEKMELREAEAECWNVSHHWSARKGILLGLFSLFSLFLGVMGVRIASSQVDPEIYYHPALQREVISFELLTQRGIWVHLNAVLLILMGIVILTYCVRNTGFSSGSGYFLKEYLWTVMGVYGAVFALTLPAYFGQSSQIYIQTGSTLSGLLLEKCYMGMYGILLLFGLLVVFYWIFEIRRFRIRNRKILTKLSKILFIVSAIFVLLQTFINPGEFLIFLLLGLLITVFLRWCCGP